MILDKPTSSLTGNLNPIHPSVLQKDAEKGPAHIDVALRLTDEGQVGICAFTTFGGTWFSVVGWVLQCESYENLFKLLALGHCVYGWIISVEGDVFVLGYCAGARCNSY